MQALGKKHIFEKTLPEKIQERIQTLVKPFCEEFQKLQDARTDYSIHYSVCRYVDRDEKGLYVKIELRKGGEWSFIDGDYDVVEEVKVYLDREREFDFYFTNDYFLYQEVYGILKGFHDCNRLGCYHDTTFGEIISQAKTELTEKLGKIEFNENFLDFLIMVIIS